MNINTFNAPFLYPLKTSENFTIFCCFQGVEKECIGNKWANENVKNFYAALMTLKEVLSKTMARKAGAISSSFPEANPKPCETLMMKFFEKLVNCNFAKSSTLGVKQGIIRLFPG